MHCVSDIELYVKDGEEDVKLNDVTTIDKIFCVIYDFFSRAGQLVA